MNILFLGRSNTPLSFWYINTLKAHSGETVVLNTQPSLVDEIEVVAVDTPEEWVAAIMYYLDHPSETEQFRIAARKRALTDHTWDKRAEQFLGWIEVHLSSWKMTDSIGIGKRIGRLRDLHLPPYGIDEAKDKIKRRARRFTTL